MKTFTKRTSLDIVQREDTVPQNDDCTSNDGLLRISNITDDGTDNTARCNDGFDLIITLKVKAILSG